MNFTTQVPIKKSNKPIDYNSKIVSLGSCFAEHIGAKFNYFKFQSLVNPFGIIFNAVSIEKLVSRIVNNQEFTENDIFFHNDLWHCYEVHSEVSNPNKEDLLNKLNTILHDTKEQITTSTHIIITYGTSWVYRNKALDNIVANCHKMPQSEFDKEIISVETNEKSIRDTIELIQKINANCTFIFTVSPVRHIKDGFVENQLSKAHLISGLQSVISNEETVNYFPSYEIMMDELRDYRFYAEDMLHPSKVAINYIWERFSEYYISEEHYSIMEEVSTIQKSLLHRPFNPSSESHLKFIENLKIKIDKLVVLYPKINF